VYEEGGKKNIMTPEEYPKHFSAWVTSFSINYSRVHWSNQLQNAAQLTHEHVSLIGTCITDKRT